MMNGEMTIYRATAAQNKTIYRWLFEIGPLAFVILSLWAKQIYFSLSARSMWSAPGESFGQWASTHTSLFLVSLACLLLFFGPLLFLPRSWRFSLLLLLNFLLTTIILTDLLYTQYFGNITSVLLLPNLRMLGAIIPSIVELLQLEHLLLYLDVIAGAVMWVPYVRFARQDCGLERKQVTTLSMGLIVVGVLLCAPVIRLVWQKKDWVLTTVPRNEVCSVIGLFPYHIFDAIGNLRADKAKVGDAGLQKVLAFFNAQRGQARPPSNLFGAARGRNLIIISAESIHGFPLGLEVDGQLITPQLSAFAKESLNFINFYDQTHLGSTSDGEFTSLHSLYPPSSGAVAKNYPSNHFFGLPQILSHNGYTTLSACGAQGDFWNMSRIHQRYGFQQSYFEDSFKVSERINGQWMADKDFFTQMTPILESQHEPFLAFLLSSSSHHPFKIPQKYHELKLGRLEGTYLGDYLHTVHYFDQAFGEFVARLRKTGLLEKSVIILYGDHAAFNYQHEPDLLTFLSMPADEYHRFRARMKLPLLIRLPQGAAAQQLRVPAGHLDIAPTALSLLGISGYSHLMLGRDLTAEGNSLVVFRNNGFADEKHYFISHSDATSVSSCYEAETGRAIDCQLLQAQRRAALERVEISDLVLQGDLMLDLVATGLLPFQYEARNILPNPGFEELESRKPAAWGLAGEPKADASGQYSLGGRVAVQSTGVRDVIYQTVSLPSASIYLLSCEARTAVQAGQGKLQVNWYDADNKLLKEEVEVIETGENWKLYKKTLTAPAAAKTAIIYASALDPSIVWFDDFSFGELKHSSKP